ncbi:hypothetical protein LZC95_21185 [Pendulispora brunnea]|uniref:Uncharacterized protein n=1 Tax=Pendulispora brunnea TaxID=2905690 RepID=A0ABZ2KNT9_9BACT
MNAMTTTSSCGCSKKGQGQGTACSSCAAAAGQAGAQDCTSGTEEATSRKGVVAPACLSPRPRFFPGQMVTDADLRAVVDYHRNQQRVAESVTGGWGVYCGYELTLEPETCSIVVHSGVAYDARGRALIHPAETRLTRPLPADVGRPKRDPCDPCVTPPQNERFYLAVVYDDCLDAAKPRYGTPCGPSADPGCDFSRVKERVRFVWLNEISDSYWTSGCLVDECKDPAPPHTTFVDDCAYTDPTQEPAERLLAKCTPDVGIRGGVGTYTYARHLEHRWNLSKNVSFLQHELARDGQGTPENRGAAAGALLDVISSVGCEPCPGEAVVVLAEVFFTTLADRTPQIVVKPLRRRVLSNADLTMLVGYLLGQLVGQPPQGEKPAAEGTEPPRQDALCTDPCGSSLIGQIGKAITAMAPNMTPVLQDTETAKPLTKSVKLAQSDMALRVIQHGKRVPGDFKQDEFEDIVLQAIPQGTVVPEAVRKTGYNIFLGLPERVGTAPDPAPALADVLKRLAEAEQQVERLKREQEKPSSEPDESGEAAAATADEPPRPDDPAKADEAQKLLKGDKRRR